MNPTIVNFTYTEPFAVHINPVTRQPKLWKEEVLATAKAIADSTTRPIILCYSGGIDSEVIARAFIEQNIAFSVLTIKHKAGTNEHDIAYTYAFCQKYNIKQTIIELDIEEFFATGIEKYIEQGYQSVNVYRYFQLFLMETVEKMGGLCIIGSGEQIYANVNDQVCLPYTPELAVVISWCKNNNVPHQPFFHMSNSELVASYLQIPRIQLCHKNPKLYPVPDPARLGPMKSGMDKIECYHDFWPEMERRPAYHGYENINQSRWARQRELKKRFPDLQLIHVPVSTIKQQLGI